MTVILVLLFFVLFLLIDYFYGPKPVARPEVQLVVTAPGVVAGFRMPENLAYHPGHTWACREGHKLVSVGIDDFAAHLLGEVQYITLPLRGYWVRQGQKIWTVERNGVKVDMVSPIEGIVVDVNDKAAKDPGLVRRDPYGDGWLVSVQSPDAKINFRNLLNGKLARWWMEEAAARLRKFMPIPEGVMQDGGTVIDGLTVHLGDDEWAGLAREFFLN
jgi:glycine cleavage system H lipoate-binding protein